jgi:deazaflavin-dependent oxidoreductase (nitroreductase family)
MAMAVLRSPLHRIMSKSLLVLTYAGRRSAKTYELPLQYIEVGGRLVIWAGNAAEKTWWRNFETPAAALVRLRGRDVDAKASLIEDPGEQTRALRAYLARYPITTPSGRPKILGERWKPTDDELAEVAASTVWVAIDLS